MSIRSNPGGNKKGFVGGTYRPLGTKTPDQNITKQEGLHPQPLEQPDTPWTGPPTKLKGKRRDGQGQKQSSGKGIGPSKNPSQRNKKHVATYFRGTKPTKLVDRRSSKKPTRRKGRMEKSERGVMLGGGGGTRGGTGHQKIGEAKRAHPVEKKGGWASEMGHGRRPRGTQCKSIKS